MYFCLNLINISIMNIRLLIICLLLSFAGKAQQLTFKYDGAGNQIKREILFDSGRNSKTPAKEIADLTEQDLLRFSPQDNLSYYPNPVSEELYLKWQLENNIKVVSIEVSTINGQLIKSFKKTENDNQTIPFQEFSAGIYFVNLNYSNGDKKSIKIIKK